MPYVRRRRTAPRRKTYRRTTRTYRRKGARTAYRALRIARSVSRKVAGEVCKFESTPAMYTNNTLTAYGSTTTSIAVVKNSPLTTITSGTPWVMPINWIYTGADQQTYTSSTYTINGQRMSPAQLNASGLLPWDGISVRNPIWFNTMQNNGVTDASPSDETFGQSTQYQYRLKYIYINALFNTDGNTDGALRIVFVKDKQSTGGAPTWYDPYTAAGNNPDNSRGVFNAPRIDAQLNPQTLGRFKIMYDKTLRFTTINSYKPWKFFRRIASIVRNNRATLYRANATDYLQTKDQPPPVQRNAYYLMMFPDGVNFDYTTESSTGEGAFHMFTRIAYYNN